MQLLKHIALSALAIFVVVLMIFAVLCIEAFLAVVGFCIGLCEFVADWYDSAKRRFKKTFFYLAWSQLVWPTLRKIKNFLLSRYELSCKQETLFEVMVKRDGEWGPTFYLVGTVERGSFDYKLEPIGYEMSTLINEIKVSHMSLKPHSVTGPIFMVPGDTLQLSYGKTVTLQSN